MIVIILDIFADDMTLNLRQLWMHWCALCTVATDALVLQHQGISTHSADHIFFVMD